MTVSVALQSLFLKKMDGFLTARPERNPFITHTYDCQCNSSALFAADGCSTLFLFTPQTAPA